MDEIIDIFNENFHHIGTAAKSVVHKEGLWHQTFHCWIIRKNGDRRYILFQKRANEKEDSPNLLDISAAGHLLAGETKELGVREIEEELGINPLLNHMHYLGVRITAYRFNNICNYEFNHVYLLEDNTILENFELRQNEVSGLVEIDIEEGLKLFSGQVNKIYGSFFKTKCGQPQSIRLQMEDFIPRVDQYYLRICSIADLYFDGHSCLCI
ncbi:NUDIX domain-containing protein [Clostridium sp. YIM B02505]|uniref:NUDIX domain-containing protein n=1 Tax=Clostridium yunnanense TaxID=2800325 RepID=A0ABS1EPJ3_9CLOT|nr:NUDIX domain-containing protein [Clostridium yunnanense]MBK1811290.1 NUDIX domain-containing protein [Clostridium yunnanense]